jgi:hypothetical protein
MNAITTIFTSLLLIYASGYALEKTHEEVRAAAIKRAHDGIPSLSKFAGQLTRARFSASSGKPERSEGSRCKRTRKQN